MKKPMDILFIALVSIISVVGCSDANNTAPVTPESNDQVQAFYNGITEQNKGSRSGDVEVKGSLQVFKTGKLYLWETQGKNTTKIDSTVVANGAFSFGTKTYETGIYMLGLNDNNMCPVIINPAEPVVDLQFTGGKLETSLTSATSKENEGWGKYIVQEPVLLKAIKDARVAGAKNASMKGQYDQQVAAKEKELLKLQGDLIAQYPNTQLAKILTWKQEPNKTEIGKYWDNVDFSDRSIVRSRVLTDRIESFMRTFSKGEESGFYNCIAMVAEKAKADDVVLEFALNQMLTGFYESNMENICTFIIDNYVNGDACGDADLSNIIKSTAESIQNLGLGKTPPNIQLTSLSGGAVDLYKTAASKKYTLVMFWSSFCEHCKGEAPEVVACYSQWKDKGFDIIGVSIDRSKAAWEAAVKDRGFVFANVCGMNDYQSKVAKDYRVTRTPTFFLLDSNKQIVLKPKGIRDVQAFLAKNVK
jgi:thiol-disulfide isomerase/thioredoxin